MAISWPVNVLPAKVLNRNIESPYTYSRTTISSDHLAYVSLFSECLVHLFKMPSFGCMSLGVLNQLKYEITFLQTRICNVCNTVLWNRGLESTQFNQ